MYVNMKYYVCVYICLYKCTDVLMVLVVIICIWGLLKEFPVRNYVHISTRVYLCLFHSGKSIADFKSWGTRVTIVTPGIQH